MAEARIANVSPAFGDSILEYRNRYPDDGYLRLWAGLLLARRKRPAFAAAEFRQSIERGCDHWRIFWYLARAAREAGSATIADNALARVRAAVTASDAQAIEDLTEDAARELEVLKATPTPLSPA